MVERIRRAAPGFLFVALGCPRQEKWIARYLGNLSCVAIGVGAALPVYAGVRRRAPVSMQRNGLEWLYRLGQEPGRLWKRYLPSNALFLWWVLRGYRGMDDGTPGLLDINVSSGAGSND
jgi:N-acetylglucosaminyldiphosphoundecaprenol N-acetyl-beta-D-mannosaminyltransferase